MIKKHLPEMVVHQFIAFIILAIKEEIIQSVAVILNLVDNKRKKVTGWQ